MTCLGIMVSGQFVTTIVSVSLMQTDHMFKTECMILSILLIYLFLLVCLSLFARKQKKQNKNKTNISNQWRI